MQVLGSKAMHWLRTVAGSWALLLSRLPWRPCCRAHTLPPRKFTLTVCTSVPTSAAGLAKPVQPGIKTMPSVAHLFRAPKRRLPMEEVETVEVVADLGFAACAHARKGGSRQVLL